MPVLCVLLKQPASATPTGASPSAVDELRLGALLCPYRGGIQRVAIAMRGGAVGVLRLSSLAGVGESKCVIPADTSKNASTAWLEITVDPSGLTFETDPTGNLPTLVFRGRLTRRDHERSEEPDRAAGHSDRTRRQRSAESPPSCRLQPLPGRPARVPRCNPSRFADVGADRRATHAPRLPTDLDVRDRCCERGRSRHRADRLRPRDLR